jgi:hypothetical protein
MMRGNGFPRGLVEERMRKVLAHYEEQTGAGAVADDEAAFEDPPQTVMELLTALVPAIREVIARHKSESGGANRSKHNRVEAQ